MDNNEEIEIARLSVDSFGSESDENVVEIRNKSPKPSIWRPSSLTQFIIPKRRESRNGSVYDSTPLQSPDIEETSSIVSRRVSRLSQASVTKEEHGTTVSVVVVEAKGLPNAPSDGSSHTLYCKIRLGSHTLKTKSVNSSQHPVWQERLQLRQHGEYLLRASLWDKGKQKSFMGSCALDLSHLSDDRTHEVWQTLDDGYGKIHLAVTIWDNQKRQNISLETNLKEKYALFNLHQLDSVGELHVRVVSAKGLSGKPYCVMQVDNEKVQTHAVNTSTEYTWDKNFIFKVYDVTSTLDLKVFDNSLVSSFRNDCMGRVIIPLLRINNGEMRWYVLKDRSKRQSTRGNCPRVLLEMTLYWNPIKASIRVFKPKEVKYDKKPRKFDIGLVYKNIEFIRDVFVSLLQIDEEYKLFLEWENRELSCMVLFCWLFFWYNFQMWATPLLLLVPFVYSWILGRHQKEKTFMRGYGIVAESPDDSVFDKPDKSLTGRIQEIPEMTITITDGIEYIASLSEKLYNLTSFKVPFLSYLTMFLLVMASIGFYLIPFNYMMIIFGLYKFSRKYFDPERVLNNDIIDFLSRLPDTAEWRNWKELNVPEPSPCLNNRRNGAWAYPASGLGGGFFEFLDLNIVGQLNVKVISGKGLGAKPYCLLQVDNVILRTEVTSSGRNFVWDQDFKINVYDVTSKLNLKVFNTYSIISSVRNNSIGSVLIPLLRIRNGEMRWYSLKNSGNRANTLANDCPRVQLVMTLYWHPIKASLKVFKPKELKYDSVRRHFNIELVYKNMQFTSDVILFMRKIDEGYRFLLEWESREYSCMYLFWWLFFWYFFRMWATPLLLLIPFIYSWIFKRQRRETSFMREYVMEEDSDEDVTKESIARSFSQRLLFIQELSISTTEAIEYAASLTEKLYNLARFKVPFLSYLTMFLLVMTSVVCYFMPFNYIMIIFGLYKFSRKYFDPERERNNDIIDFFSRIPDTKEWNSWKEIDFRESRPQRISYADILKGWK